MNTCYKCQKENDNLKPLNDRLYCEKCYSKIEKSILASEGFNEIRCPKCDNIMVGGKSKIHGTIGGFFVFGLSHQHLWFEPSDGSYKEKIVLEPNRYTKSSFCNKCKIMVIETYDYESYKW
jgi:hypothetical protein